MPPSSFSFRTTAERAASYCSLSFPSDASFLFFIRRIETNKKQKKREDAEKDLKAKMEEVKRKREAIDLVDGEYRFFQSLADKALVVLNA